MTIYYKALFSGRIETRSTQARTFAACLVVTWPGKHGAASYVTWCGTQGRARSEAVRERARGRTADVADAVEIDAAEYRILKAATRTKGRP